MAFPESSALLRIQPVHNPYFTHYTHNLYVSVFVFILSQHTYFIEESTIQYCFPHIS